MSEARQTVSLLESYTTLLTEDFPFAKQDNYAKYQSCEQLQGDRTVYSHKISCVLHFDSRG